MRRDTLAWGVILIFLLPFSFSIGAGYFIDYEKTCSKGSGCPKHSKCVSGVCQSTVGCGRNFQGTSSRASLKREWKESARDRRSAWRRWRQNRTPENQREYKEALRIYRTKLKMYTSSIRRRRDIYACPGRSICDRTKGYCYYRSSGYSSLIYFHPGYYPHRARMRRRARDTRSSRTRRSGRYRSRTGSRYRSTRSFRGFRGGGLGFGK